MNHIKLLLCLLFTIPYSLSGENNSPSFSKEESFKSLSICECSPWGSCGHRGRRGKTGPTGPTGPAGSGSSVPTFSSLVFTSQSAALTSDVFPINLPVGNSNSFIGAAVIPQPVNGNSTSPATFTFNIPVDYVDTEATELVIHFLTDNSGTSGNVTIGVQYSFVNTQSQTPPALPITALTVENITGSGANNFYNHYEAALSMGEIGAQANDLVIFGVIRTGSSDTYEAPVYLTSIEFRYTSTPTP